MSKWARARGGAAEGGQDFKGPSPLRNFVGGFQEQRVRRVCGRVHRSARAWTASMATYSPAIFAIITPPSKSTSTALVPTSCSGKGRRRLRGNTGNKVRRKASLEHTHAPPHPSSRSLTDDVHVLCAAAHGIKLFQLADCLNSSFLIAIDSFGFICLPYSNYACTHFPLTLHAPLPSLTPPLSLRTTSSPAHSPTPPPPSHPYSAPPRNTCQMSQNHHTPILTSVVPTYWLGGLGPPHSIALVCCWCFCSRCCCDSRGRMARLARRHK